MNHLYYSKPTSFTGCGLLDRSSRYADTIAGLVSGSQKRLANLLVTGELSLQT